jgi:hypothetical protein
VEICRQTSTANASSIESLVVQKESQFHGVQDGALLENRAD